jgi:hypothetical protein
LGGTGGSGGGADGPLMGRSTCILTQHGSLFPERARDLYSAHQGSKRPLLFGNSHNRQGDQMRRYIGNAAGKIDALSFAIFGRQGLAEGG